MIMDIKRVLLAFLVSSHLLSAQGFSVVLLNEEGVPLSEPIVAKLDSYVWMSSEDGVLFIPDSTVSISLHSLTYRDTTVVVFHADSVMMKLDETALKAVDVFAHEEVKSIRHRRCRGEYQREPGDIRLLGYHADSVVFLDSLKLRIVEVLRSSARFRVVLYNADTSRVFASSLFQIDPDLADEDFVLPIQYNGALMGEFYLGVQFFEEGQDPYNWNSHLYQSKRGGLYTVFNNGVTIGSIRLKSGERIMTAEYFEGGRVKWWKGSGSDRRHRAPYFVVYYHGPGDLHTKFDD